MSSVLYKEMKQRHKPFLMIQTGFHKSPTSCKMIKFPEFPANPIFNIQTNNLVLNYVLLLCFFFFYSLYTSTVSGTLYICRLSASLHCVRDFDPSWFPRVVTVPGTELRFPNWCLINCCVTDIPFIFPGPLFFSLGIITWKFSQLF